jgi:hypothetical protein
MSMAKAEIINPEINLIKTHTPRLKTNPRKHKKQRPKAENTHDLS